MSELLKDRIAALRKERRLTQEQLGQMVGVSAQAVSKWEKGGAPDVDLLPVLADCFGVSVDTLFGREKSQRVNVEDEVRRWILTVPKEERLDRLCRLVWSAAGAAISPGGVEDASSLADYEPHGELKTVEDGVLMRWMLRSRVLMEDGIILGVRSNDLSFLTVWPEPKDGWESYLLENSFYRRVFKILAQPHVLEILEYFNSQPPMERRRRTPGAVAKTLGIGKDAAESLMAEMEEAEILAKDEMETEDGVIHGYVHTGGEGLTPLLFFARWLATSGGRYLDAPHRREPLLRGEKWKEKGTE